MTNAFQQIAEKFGLDAKIVRNIVKNSTYEISENDLEAIEKEIKSEIEFNARKSVPIEFYIRYKIPAAFGGHEWRVIAHRLNNEIKIQHMSLSTDWHTIRELTRQEWDKIYDKYFSEEVLIIKDQDGNKHVAVKTISTFRYETDIEFGINRLFGD